MKLSKLKEDYNYHTTKASDVARQLAMAGLAIVWIFKIGDGNKIKIPDDLLYPLGMFALALSLDLLQYIVASIILGRFYKKNEQRYKATSEDPELEVPQWHDMVPLIPYILKFFMIFTGYIFILKYFYNIWF